MAGRIKFRSKGGGRKGGRKKEEGRRRKEEGRRRKGYEARVHDLT